MGEQYVESFPINLKAIVPSSSGPPSPSTVHCTSFSFRHLFQEGGVLGENEGTQRHASFFYNNFKTEFRKLECFQMR
jgi:hypothetical protein